MANIGTKKNVGTRTKTSVRTPEDQRKHRAEQAARAILAGRGDWHANWDRIERHLRDLPVKIGFFAGLAIPEAIQESVWPTPAPVAEETVEEIGVLVTDPLFGEVMEIEMSPDDIPPAESAAEES